MENTTKDRLLEEALVSFSENGFKGTNLRDLAARLGLSKSALYRHYASKDEIWNAMVDRMIGYYDAHIDRHPGTPQSCADLLALTMRFAGFTIRDPQIIRTRKLIMTEQFRDERVAALANEYFVDGTKRLFADVFRRMMDAGLLRRDDPEMLAFAYTAPITVLIHRSDREPGREQEITGQIQAFAGHFIEMYRAEPAGGGAPCSGTAE